MPGEEKVGFRLGYSTTDNCPAIYLTVKKSDRNNTRQWFGLTFSLHLTVDQSSYLLLCEKSPQM